jgi:uncharacterized Ntn-hydrolase superfamily protein
VTWSILVRDPETGKFGVAVATRFFAVGALVPHARAGIGAVATQALINPFFGFDGLKLLQDGLPAADVIAKLVAGDNGGDHRQVHVIDTQGRTAAHTGHSCVDWCGVMSERDLSVAGNMLANAEVIAATASTFRSKAALPLAQRLIAAMKAGEAAGGDKRGRQSAALLIQGDEAWPDLSLRVDDHADPLGELERLEAVSRERFVHFMHFLPSRRDRVGETDRTMIEAGINKALAQRSAQPRP